MNDREITILYRNHRGEIARRRIRPDRIWFGPTEWHPEPQWLLEAFDVDKDAARSFALRDVLSFAPQAKGGGEKFAAIWELHPRRPAEALGLVSYDHCGTCQGFVQVGGERCIGPEAWPCPTIRALDEGGDP